MDEIKTIPLTQGAVALVSAEDYEMISQHKWHLTSGGYAARKDVITGERLYMHRVVNRTPAGMETDHKDRNRLNNVRSNLRTGTHRQNSANQSKQCGARSSQFKGVHYRSSRAVGGGAGCWNAYVKVDGKKKSLGNYATEMDAALAYNIAAKKAFGEFAHLNVLPLDFLASKKEPAVFCDRGYSKYRGVTWSKSMKLWMAYLHSNGKRVHVSYHETELAAAVAYNQACAQVHGANAKLNTLPDGDRLPVVV